jgi:hypothetical protein
MERKESSVKSIKFPRKCECGGTIKYTPDFGRVFSYCTKCTPVVSIRVPNKSD